VKSSTPELVELTIDSIASSGDGVGRQDGLVYFVPFSAPGDRLLVRVLHRKKGFVRAAVETILAPGPGRRSPPCPVYGRCGGCSLQHLSEEIQNEAKLRIVREALVRIGGLERDRVNEITFWTSPNLWNYRNRIQVRVDSSGEFTKTVGFNARGSHELVPIDRCLIADESLNERLSELRQRPPGRYELSVRPEGGVEISASGLSAESRFSQVNTEGNAILQRTVAEWIRCLDLPRDAVAWDLYAGSGNFSGSLSAQVGLQWTAVEGSAQSVQAGQRQHPNISWQHDDVHVWLKKQRRAAPLVVVDPPRVGMGLTTAAMLAALEPTHIIYISCDPGSLARDCRVLTKAGYRFEAGRAVDLFPQTEHVETLLHLVR
jgi:23S rRNA (uracil1939-C5)-methyltransferase